MWFLLKAVILTKDNLLKRHWRGDHWCYFCDKNETIQHFSLIVIFYVRNLANIENWERGHVASFSRPSDRTCGGLRSSKDRSFWKKDPQLSHIQTCSPRTRLECLMRQSNSRAPAAAASGATAHGGGRAGEGGERGRRRKADEGTEKGEQETRDREGRTQETRKEKVAPLESSGRGGRHDGRESKRLPPGWTSMRRGRAHRATPEELLLHPVAPLPITTAGSWARSPRDAGVPPSPRDAPRSPLCPTRGAGSSLLQDEPARRKMK
jgi:hypothetical protein